VSTTTQDRTLFRISSFLLRQIVCGLSLTLSWLSRLSLVQLPISLRLLDHLQHLAGMTKVMADRNHLIWFLRTQYLMQKRQILVIHEIASQKMIERQRNYSIDGQRHQEGEEQATP
jgi:hypothetical protein